jgi:hypothetical protein
MPESGIFGIQTLTSHGSPFRMCAGASTRLNREPGVRGGRVLPLRGAVKLG